MSGLPLGWREAEFKELTVNFDGKRIPVKASDRAARRGSYRYFGAQGVIDHIDDYIFDGTYLLIAEDGANLVSRAQPIAQIANGKFWVNNHAHVVQNTEAASLRYLMHFLNGNRLTGAIRGTAQPKLTQADLNRLRVPLPPVLEQERIVNVIEEQFSRLDVGIEALRSARRRALQMHDAVLEAAVSGCLTGDSTVWPVVALSDIANVCGGITKNPKRSPSSNAFPFLRVANVLRDKLDLSEVHQIELFPGDLERYRLRRGDLLIVEGNGSPDQIGRSALWDGSIDPCVHQNHLIRARPHEGAIIPEYLNIFWNAPRTKAILRAAASSTSGLHTLSTGKIRKIEVILPPLQQQQLIIQEVERQLSIIDGVDNGLSANYAKSRILRQSILSTAFAGKLI